MQATQYVGVVRLGRETIQVLPKIYRHEECGPDEAARNLLHLLAVAADLPVREHALAPLLRRHADWFEILTRLFATHLTDAWQRGVVRGYVPIEDNDSPLLRGKWRLTAQLRRPAHRHRFCVTYDEFTPDNPLNRVLRFVVERLWTLTRDGDNRRALSTLRAWMDEVTLLPNVTAAEASAVSLTRLHPVLRAPADPGPALPRRRLLTAFGRRPRLVRLRLRHEPPVRVLRLRSSSAATVPPSSRRLWPTAPCSPNRRGPPDTSPNAKAAPSST